MCRFIVVTTLDIIGGGGIRARRSIEYYKAQGMDLEVMIPLIRYRKIDEEANLLRDLKSLYKELSKIGINQINIAEFKAVSSVFPILRRTSAKLEPELRRAINIFGNMVQTKKVKRKDPKKCVVIALQETPSTLLLAEKLAHIEVCNKAAVLQLPPFYGDKNRFLKLLRSHEIWLQILFSERSAIATKNIINLTNFLSKLILSRVLRGYNLVIAVSKSIPLEMNIDLGNMAVLDPGVSLDEKDLDVIMKVKRATYDKDKIALYSARIAPEKGLVEALYAFRIMSRRVPGLRLVVSGRIEDKVEMALRRFVKRLGIHDKVVFLGYVSREELFRLKARALVHIYPSHEDSFSYSVLESLALGTPVAAYNIPALKINYLEKGAEGISLVEEFDVKGLAEEALKIMGQRASPPKIPSWGEIMEKELSLIKRLIDAG